MKLRINDNGLIKTFIDEEIIYIPHDDKNKQKKAIKKTFDLTVDQIKIIGVMVETGTRFFIYKILNGKMYVMIQQVSVQDKEYYINKKWGSFPVNRIKNIT